MSVKEYPIKIQGLEFDLFTDFCPTQYYVYKNDKCVAYVRLRWGDLEVHPAIGENVFNDEIDFDRTIYENSEFEFAQGSFHSEEQELDTLMKCASAINEFIATGKTQEEIEEEKERQKKQRQKPPFELPKEVCERICKLAFENADKEAEKASSLLKISIPEIPEIRIPYNPKIQKTCELVEVKKRRKK